MTNVTLEEEAGNNRGRKKGLRISRRKKAVP